jgi:hypothetical protein
LKEKSDFLMSDAKKEVPQAETVSAAPAAKKVHSSRYEWENKSSENENKPVASKTPRQSFMTALGAWVRKTFLGNRDLFDNDDDASPSAA